MNTAQTARFGGKARKAFMGAAILGAAALLSVVAWRMFGDLKDQAQPFVYYTVARSDLPLIVTERGSLESQVETAIQCEVESMSVDRSGNLGTQIIFIVPNGSAVNEGDLLVELDSAAIRERLDQQTLAHQRAISANIQAQAKYENQITQNKTLEAQAELKVQLADLNLQMYMDEENGTFKLSVDDIDRQIDEAKNQILESQAALELQKTEKSGIQTLFELGYRGKSDLDQSRFKFLQSEDRLAASVNKMTTFQATRRKLEKYEFKMQELQLEGEVATAERNLEQVRTDNISLLAQVLAAKEEAEQTAIKEKERLEKLEHQLVKCKIFAPHDGMVVYARENNRSNTTEIAEGTTVRERQRILSLPDLSRMQVKTQIHEAVLNQVRVDLPVTVRIDSLPNHVFSGIVHNVGVVPSSGGWGGGSSVKTYDCTVRIEGTVDQLKPGMTAVVEVHIDRMRDVLAVPVQSIVQVEKNTWGYVETSQGVQRRPLKLGISNDKFVHILEGLNEGDRLVLNPMAIADESASKTNEISPESGASDVPLTAARDNPSLVPTNAAAISPRGGPAASREGAGRAAGTDSGEGRRGKAQRPTTEASRVSAAE